MIILHKTKKIRSRYEIDLYVRVGFVWILHAIKYRNLVYCQQFVNLINYFSIVDSNFVSIWYQGTNLYKEIDTFSINYVEKMENGWRLTGLSCIFVLELIEHSL